MNNPFKSVPVRSSEITPKETYLSRRDFIKAAGVVAGSMALTACAPEVADITPESLAVDTGAILMDELNDPANTLEELSLIHI